MRQRDGHYVDDDERDKILEAIEQQARNISQSRGPHEGQRLSDWLSAAEDVMPEVKKPTVKPMSLASKSGSSESKGVSASALMGMVTAGTVVLGLAIGGSLAYMQVMEKVGDLDSTTQQLTQRLASFEEAFKEVQQSAGDKMVGISADGQVQAVTAMSHSISAEFIDARLQAQTSLIAKEMEERFQQLMDRLDGKLAAIRAEQMEKIKEVASTPVVVSLPTPTPIVEAPLAMTPPVSSASGATTPIAPIAPIAVPSVPMVAEPVVKAPANTTPESKTEKGLDTGASANAWLQELNPDVFVLQLGSSPKMEGLDPTIKKMRTPETAHLVSVKANGTQRFILVTGPFESREEAKKAADQARIELGITAWMRKVSDVRALLERQQ